MNSQLKKILNHLKVINLKDNLNNLTSCDVLFFCNDANRSLQLNHCAYSPLLDSIREQFEQRGYKCISIANPFASLVVEKAYGHPLAMNKSFFFAYVKGKLITKLSPIKHDINPLLNLYENIFEQAKPKLIITINCNDSLCMAARKKAIYHVELLHGIGYTPMPWGWNKKDKFNLPQGIFSLDEVSTKTFRELEKQGVNVIQIPHPFLSRFTLNKIKSIPEEWNLRKREKKQKKEILVSLQWAFSGDHGSHHYLANILPNGLFFDELAEVIHLTKNEVLWHFRFHPVQYRNLKKYKSLFDFINEFIRQNINCEWEEATYLPLPSILAQCDGHITMHSMSAYEAAYMGVNTLALSPTIRPGGRHENMFNDLVDKGYMLKQAPKTEQILHWVKEVKRSEPLLNNLNDEYWFERLLETLPLD